MPQVRSWLSAEMARQKCGTPMRMRQSLAEWSSLRGNSRASSAADQAPRVEGDDQFDFAAPFWASPPARWKASTEVLWRIQKLRAAICGDTFVILVQPSRSSGNQRCFRASPSSRTSHGGHAFAPQGSVCGKHGEQRHTEPILKAKLASCDHKPPTARATADLRPMASRTWRHSCADGASNHSSSLDSN